MVVMKKKFKIQLLLISRNCLGALRSYFFILHFSITIQNTNVNQQRRKKRICTELVNLLVKQNLFLRRGQKLMRYVLTISILYF